MKCLNSKWQPIPNPAQQSQIRILCILLCCQLCHQPMQCGTRAAVPPSPPFSLNKYVSSAYCIPSTVVHATNSLSPRLCQPTHPSTLPTWLVFSVSFFSSFSGSLSCRRWTAAPAPLAMGESSPLQDLTSCRRHRRSERSMGSPWTQGDLS